MPPLPPSFARPRPSLPLPPDPIGLARRDAVIAPVGASLPPSQRFSHWRDEAKWLESRTSRTRPWTAAPHYYRPETQILGQTAEDFDALMNPQPPAERYATGMPLFDTIFKGVWMQHLPVGWSGMRPLELILLLLWLVKSEVINALAFPFLMLFLPMFNDGKGALSIITGHGALPEFKHLMGAENYAPAAPPSPPWMATHWD